LTGKRFSSSSSKVTFAASAAAIHFAHRRSTVSPYGLSLTNRYRPFLTGP
jgi:hypothetical protein